MTDYDPTNRGAMFDNDRKQSNTHPDMNGKLNVNGVEHWISGWWKESKKGDQFLSLSLGKPVEGQQEQRQQPAPRRGNRPPPSRSGGYRDDGPDRDVPFAPIGAGRAFLAI